MNIDHPYIGYATRSHHNGPRWDIRREPDVTQVSECVGRRESVVARREQPRNRGVYRKDTFTADSKLELIQLFRNR